MQVFNHRGKVLPIFAIAVLPFSASALDFTGYVRSGIGGAVEGGKQSCFQLPGAPSKYRLGNECEQYIELDLREDLLRLDDGSAISVEGMAQLYNQYGHTPRFSDDYGFARMSQLYAEWSKMPALNGGSFWAGRRYYKRNDIHISDYYYWNQSGTGFGVDSVPIGDLQYSYVFSRKDNQDQKDYVTRQDFNVAGFQPNTNGSLEFGLSVTDKPGGEDMHGGWAISAQHKQKGFLGGLNTFALQYGRGPGSALGYTGNTALDQDNKSWRAVEYFDWQVTPRFGGQIQAIYQKDIRANGSDQNWISLGVRPTYALTDQFKLVTEIGHDQIDAVGGTRKLTKFTIAPTWSPAGPGFWQRPEFRLYYTYASWNEAAQRAASLMAAGSALSDSGAFGDALHGSNVGVQVEYWWK
ncbi:carbohydrate porin [Pseudomonas sp. CBS]|uniref:maltoporin n=1 Tax=Pseudomonas sp. CBS TaxID=2971912 RepID=UPI0021AC7DAB|nr:carbohydrate porin [Pseudomonas sp. CBS]UVH51827.1 carbohydrate porin [Pseudomonas sp. CBS]WEL64607.1 carbohydrate porin [Pseudomonas sp. CBSPGW29]WEL75096.1 carbohydrate porin [Pseudomonas sp. CBSPAW29]WEL89175.1 carbohydrate porin [Pseudomonas sp. CBSPCBW29]